MIIEYISIPINNYYGDIYNCRPLTLYSPQI